MGVQSEKDLKDAARARDFEVKDSGQRMQFDSGMVRDTAAGKVDYWRVFVGPMFERLAVHVTKGAVKYPDIKQGVPNWTLAAGEAELQRFKASAARHFYQWMQGDTDEDHAAAVAFNLNGYEFVKDKMIAEFNAELDNPARELVPPTLSLLRANFEAEPALRPELPVARELVQVGRRAVMLPTPQETLRRIQAMEQSDVQPRHKGRIEPEEC